MAIYHGHPKGRAVIDLNGPEGNAFILLGYASRLGKELGFTREQKEEIHKELISGDYDHLLETFDKHFGAYVDLYR